ncbi:MAG: RNA polymerase sigma-70 factor [Bacteroidota bacterium]
MSKKLCKEENFKELFYSFAGQLRNFVYYKSGNMAQAEDLVQDAFSKLWENCAKVPPEKARAYLYRVANNLFLNQVDHQKVVLKFEKRTHKDRDAESPQYLLEVEEFQQRLAEAIAALPENQRIVFLMNRIDKKTYKEIAVELGISEKTIESRMHKALKTLRKIHKKV